MEFSLTDLLSGPVLIGTRVAGLMIFGPFFGHGAIPARVKAVLVIAITAALCPVYSVPAGILTVSSWPLTVGRELMIGIGVGAATNFAFEAALLAGQVVGIQMGYSLVNILDPQTQVDTTVMSVFHQTVAYLIFLELDVHHWILRAIARSFQYLTPGPMNLDPGFSLALLHGAASILGTGLQIAAPVLAATLIADLILGFLGKASPQMPLMLLGPALKSVLGIGVLMSTVHYWPALFDRYFTNSMSFTERLLHLAAK